MLRNTVSNTSPELSVLLLNFHVRPAKLLDQQHELIDEDGPAIGLLVLAQVALRHVIELYHHLPGVRVH